MVHNLMVYVFQLFKLGKSSKVECVSVGVERCFKWNMMFMILLQKVLIWKKYLTIDTTH